MIKVLYSSSDQVVGQRLVEDFRKAGYEVSLEPPLHGDVLVMVLSQAAMDDAALQAALIKALDLSLHIVPVMSQPIQLPKLIDHLDVVNFSDSYDFAVLRKQVDLELSPAAPLAMRVRTPSVKRSNRSTGVVVAAAALIMFIVGLIAVGIYHIQAPIQEFNTVDTEVAMTRDIMVKPQMQIYGQFFPQSTLDAENYLPTLLAVPTVYRPLIAMTATAIVTTPTPGQDDGSDFGF